MTYALPGYRPISTPATDVYVTLDTWAAPATDADGTVWVCTNVDGWNGTPDVRVSAEDRAQDHGQYDGPNFYGARTITIEGTAFATSRENCMKAQDIMSSVAAWDSTALYPLTVVEPGRPPRQCMVRLDGATKVSPVYGGLQFDWQLALRAPDPLRYGDELSVPMVLPPPGGADDLALPVTFPFYIPWLTASSISVDVTNAGTIASRRLVAVLAGPVVDPTLTNATTGLSLSFDMTLYAGDTLTCDFKARTAVRTGFVPGPAEHSLKPSAAWWSLPPGPSSIVLGGLGDTGSGCEFRYRSAWL